MFCATCGNEVPENAQFCGHCGAQLAPAGTGGSSEPAVPADGAPEEGAGNNVLSWEAAGQRSGDVLASGGQTEAPPEGKAGAAQPNYDGTYQGNDAPQFTPDFTGFPEDDGPNDQTAGAYQTAAERGSAGHRAASRSRARSGRSKLDLTNLPMLISLLAIICAGFSFVDALISSIHYRHFYLLAFLSVAAFAYLAVLFFIRRFNAQILIALGVQCLVAYTVFAREVSVVNFFYFLAAAVLVLFMLCMANPRLARYKKLAQYLYLAPVVVGAVFFILFLIFSFRGLADLRYYYGQGAVSALHYLTLIFQCLAYLAMTVLFFFIPYWMKEKDPIHLK